MQGHEVLFVKEHTEKTAKPDGSIDKSNATESESMWRTVFKTALLTGLRPLRFLAVAEYLGSSWWYEFFVFLPIQRENYCSVSYFA